MARRPNCVLRSLFAGLGFLLCAAAALPQGARVKPIQGDTEIEQADRVRERQRWFMHGRQVPGQSSAALLEKAYRQKLQMQPAATAAGSGTGSHFTAAGPFVSGAGPTWQSLGPAPMVSDPTGFQSYGNVTGRVTAIAVDQGDPTGNTVYVGAAYGGVWKSTNAADPNPSNVIWTPLTEGEATLSIGSIAVNGNTVLAGTGEPNLAGDSYYGQGILRSTNGGATWTLISTADGGSRPFRGMGFSKLAFNTANPQVVVAAAGSTLGASNGGELFGTTRGLYFSQDNGASWHLASITDGAVPIQPGSASDVVFNATANRFFAVIRFHGFYSSVDGATWTRLANQPGPTDLTLAKCPTNPSNLTTCRLVRGQLAVRPGANEMYAWFVDQSDPSVNKGIWKTTNGAGTAWSQVSVTGINGCGDNNGCGTQQGQFNLYLAAVPQGSGTDLYAGAINIYKCAINAANPTCSTGSFVNLTHVYGCNPIANPSHVHPDQHAIDFLRTTPNVNIIYFGNDGGLYRTLSASTGLASGSCFASNAFQNLNDHLGSFTQFVSLSHDPANSSIVLGGTQDNGSPATNLSGSGAAWVAVNNGDGGFNEIDPNNVNVWYTANTDVSIQRCTNGFNCDVNAFSTVVGNATLDNDKGAFYTPYILDPQSTDRLIVGTCRVWGGLGTGAGFSALSFNFDTSAATACSGKENNLIRALAAGGPDSGGSQVIYATSAGGGPGTGAGGRVFVTTNAAGGPGTWVDRTGGINPFSFDISSVTVDRLGDATGNTAYVTVMGFGTGHVFRTSNAGASWTDISANLPDAPANALAIDPRDSQTLYLGTDVGVFLSSTGGGSWNPYGSGLPNVVVTALRTFISGGVNKLRASTYGRGIWQADLSIGDFTLGAVSASITTFTTVANSGTVTFQAAGLGPFTGGVSFACLGLPAGAQCNFSPAPASPTHLVPVTVKLNVTTVGTAAGSYPITITGNSSGVGQKTTTFTLIVQDYSLAVTPAMVTVFPSQSATFAVSMTGIQGYSNSVNLDCLAVPAGACSGGPISAGGNVNVVIPTTLGTTPQDYAVTIRGTGTDSGSTQHSTGVVVRVIDFAIAGPAGPITFAQGNPSPPITVDISGAGSFSHEVSLSCSGTAVNGGAICTFYPAATISPGNSTAPVTLVVTNAPAGTSNLQVTATVAGAPAPKSTSFNLQVNTGSGSADLTAAVSPPALPQLLLSLPAGSAITLHVSVTNNGPANALSSSLLVTFSGQVSFGTMPNGCLASTADNTISCSATLNAGQSASFDLPVTVPFRRVLTVTTTASSLATEMAPGDNVASISVQVRPRPLSRRGLPPRLP